MTTFRVDGYHKSQVVGPKKEHPQHIIYNKEYNIVNNLKNGDTKSSTFYSPKNRTLTPSDNNPVNDGRQKVNRLRP